MAAGHEALSAWLSQVTQQGVSPAQGEVPGCGTRDKEDPVSTSGHLSYKGRQGNLSRMVHITLAKNWQHRFRD